MLHETSIEDGKEIFLQKNKKQEKELTFYAIRGLIHGIYSRVLPSTSTTPTNCLPVKRRAPPSSRIPRARVTAVSKRERSGDQLSNFVSRPWQAGRRMRILN